MRVTNNMMAAQFLNGYNQSLTQLNDIQEKLSTNKDINKPSDDPVRYARSLQLRTASNTNNLFSQNATNAISWMSTSSTAVTSISNVITNIKTLVTNAANDTNPSSSYSAIAKQVNADIDELVNLGNTQLGDRYLFSGQSDTVQPFTRNTTTGVVTYNGTYDDSSNASNPTAGTITMQVSPGAADPARDKINVDGQELFGTLSTDGNKQPTLFTDLNNIVAELNSASPSSTNLSNYLGNLDTDLNTVTDAGTSLGARQAAYKTISDRLTTDSTTIASDLSANEDLDVAQASINLQKAENTYSAVLSAGAKILPKSLVDYLS